MELFAQLTKVDVEKRLVYGRAAQEVADKSGEIMDYASSKPNFEKWSADVSAASDGQSLGNLRAMHGKVAAGKLTQIEFNDAANAIDVCCKVVDNNEWDKVLEGVYTGFSIGGAYAKRWDDPVEKSEGGKALIRYTADPSELSLVDRPCIPTSKFFRILKADGVVEEVEFKAPVIKKGDLQVQGSDAEVIAFAKYLNDHSLTMGDALIKIANDRPLTKSFIIVDADSGEPSDDDKEYDTKEDAQAAIDAMDDSEKFEVVEKGQKTQGLQKGLYECQSLSGVVQSLSYLLSTVSNEADKEGDNSDIPARLGDAVTNLGQILVDMTQEEVGELSADQLQMSESIQGLIKSAQPLLKKRGARNSKSDLEKIQTMHDHSVALGAACSATKIQNGGSLVKIKSIDETLKFLTEFQKSISRTETESDLHYSDLEKGAPMGNRNAAKDYASAAKAAEKASNKADKSGRYTDHVAAMHAHEKANAAAQVPGASLQTNANVSGDKSEESRVSYHSNAIDYHDAMSTDAADNPDPRKSQEPTDLSKIELEGIATGLLNKAIEEATAPLQKLLTEANEQLTKLKAEPAPTKSILRVVGKGDDVTSETLNKVVPVTDQDGKENESASLIKMMHKTGGVPLKF
jgi:hypothetical protein